VNVFTPSRELQERLRAFYKTSQPYAGHLAAEEEAYFNRYLSLIERYGAQAQRLLDAGCGTGLSTRLLSERGRRVVGVDLSELFLKEGKQRQGENGLPLAAADILALPFQDESFDLVSSYLVVEFLPDVEKGLEEMCRVVRQQGFLIIIAPNLLSPLWPLRDFFRMLAGGAARPVWCETPGKALKTAWRNLCASVRKAFQRRPRFLYREPDLSCETVVGRDSDSVYLVCPTDLTRFLKARGFRILRSGSKSGLIEKLFPFFAVAVEVVAQKE
jgi:ubiquinone/menaquinone biosynthesis C-methylase UbiE